MLSGVRRSAGRASKVVPDRIQSSEIAIHERVIDTGSDIIAIDTIATISVRPQSRRFARWLCWGFSLFAALLSLNGVLSLLWVPSGPSVSQTTIFIASAVGYAAISVGLLFLGRRFRDITTLVLGTSDGSRFVFPSKDIAFLHEARTVLARKLNSEPTLTASISFTHSACRPLDHNQLSHATAAMSPRHDTSDGRIAFDDSTHGNGPSHGWPPASHSLEAAASPPGSMQPAYTSHNHYTPVDFSGVLPQIVDLHRFYSQHADMQHITQRLSELELLMRSGAATPEHRLRVKDLAGDLQSILHSYPAMTQLFRDVALMVPA